MTNGCAVVVSLYDILQAYLSATTNVVHNATLTGLGTVGSPLGIAQQGATSGQVLAWNGTT